MKLRNYAGIGALTLVTAVAGIECCKSIYSNIDERRIGSDHAYAINQDPSEPGLQVIFFSSEKKGHRG